MKLLTFVLRSSLGDCTANGLTSRKDNITLHWGDDIDINELPDDDLLLVERYLAGKKYLHAVPVRIKKQGEVSMAGGNFIYTSDSRFPNQYPISVHDRVER